MPAKYLTYKPIFRVDVADEEYFKIAGKVGLPELTLDVESKLWKFTTYRPELKLWKNESVIIVHRAHVPPHLWSCL